MTGEWRVRTHQTSEYWHMGSILVRLKRACVVMRGIGAECEEKEWRACAYQTSEYWYMGSMLARSAMEKKRMVECTAMGL